MENYASIFTTDIATIGLQFDGRYLIKLAYLAEKTTKKSESGLAERVKNKIEKYLDAKYKLTKITLDSRLKGSAFQQKVLQQLVLIPYGETRTYGDIAKILKTSPRAVGNACRRNPLPIIIPCHRVVAANGIGGYDGAKSGELLAIKQRLLAREGIIF